MEKTPFSRFIDLITFDQSLLVLEKELEKIHKAHEHAQSAVAAIDHELEKERSLLHDMRKQVDQEELEMNTLHEKGKSAQERSSVASSTREYQAFKKESDQLRQLQHEHEQVLLAAWNAFENTQKVFETKEAGYKEKKALLLAELQVLDQKEQELLDQVAVYEKNREAYLKDVPQEWFDKYNRMRNVVSNPVVPIIAGTCGGCSYMLRVQTVMSLDQNKMIECSGCYRLMYKNFEQPA